jgi:hypothetical protein
MSGRVKGLVERQRRRGKPYRVASQTFEQFVLVSVAEVNDE